MGEQSVYSKISPWASTQERLVTEALIANTAPADEIAEMVRPPLPQIRLFPPLVGYPSYSQRQATIDEVLGDRGLQAANPPRVDFSQSDGGYQGSARFVNGAT